LHAVKLILAGTLYIFLIIASQGMRTTLLRRHMVKNNHIVSLAFEIHTPSGIPLYPVSVEFLVADIHPRSNLREACA